MLKNFIFDFGNVLHRYCPAEIVRCFTDKEDDAAKLQAAIFRPHLWSALDIGNLSQEDFTAACCEVLPPHLHPLARQICGEWFYHLPPVPGMAELLPELRRRGFHLYLLSNIPIVFAEHLNAYPILEQFDGLVLSGGLHIVKPDPAIYRHLLARFSLRPEECVFFDDLKVNTDGAEACGIHGVVFTGVQSVSDFLKKVEATQA